MSAHEGYESNLRAQLAAGVDVEPVKPQSGVVLAQDGTIKAAKPICGNLAEKDVDALYGSSSGYRLYKKEKPEHRLMLWYRLQGYSVKETALLTGYHTNTVAAICKQPWFLEAFTTLSREFGENAVQRVLEGEVIPAIRRTVELAENATSEAVKLAANKEILDRFLGKSTVKVEQKSTGKVEVIVHDIAKLREEERKLDEQIKSLSGAN